MASLDAAGHSVSVPAWPVAMPAFEVPPPSRALTTARRPPEALPPPSRVLTTARHPPAALPRAHDGASPPLLSCALSAHDGACSRRRVAPSPELRPVRTGAARAHDGAQPGHSNGVHTHTAACGPAHAWHVARVQGAFGAGALGRDLRTGTALTVDPWPVGAVVGIEDGAVLGAWPWGRRMHAERGAASPAAASALEFAAAAVPSAAARGGWDGTPLQLLKPIRCSSLRIPGKIPNLKLNVHVQRRPVVFLTCDNCELSSVLCSPRERVLGTCG
jgi:hypothetical protein